MANDVSDVEMKKEPSVMDTQVNSRQEPSSLNLEISREHENDFEMRLRKDPTLSMEVCGLERDSSVMDTEVKTRNSTVLHMETKMSYESLDLNLDEHETLTKKQTVIMSENRVNKYKGPSVPDLEMGLVSSVQTNSLMSIGNEKSVMDTNSQVDYTDKEMSSLTPGTVSDVEMSIKKEPTELDPNMQGVITLETDMSTKTEPLFFSMAFDDSVPPTLQDMSSEDKIKVEPGVGVVDYADCADTPVPLLRARYTVTSGASSYGSTSSVYKQKLVVKLKNKVVSKYRPYSHRGRRGPARSERGMETIPSSADAGMVIKCESVSDTDMDLSQETVDDSFAGKMKQKKRGRTAKMRNPPVCYHCQQRFCSYSSLKRHHRRKHTVESLAFSCSYCDAKFARLMQLRAHERLHRGGDKTFPCQECDVVFTRACHLKVHMRKHTGERPYSCSVTDCKATFRSTSNLNRHMMKHSGLRPYICTVCGANFYQSSHLVSHVRKHTGERPFQCTQCEATFTQLTHLHRHRIKHTGKKPFECGTCGAGFVEKCGLRKHMQTHNKRLPSDSVNVLKQNIRKKTTVSVESDSQHTTAALEGDILQPSSVHS